MKTEIIVIRHCEKCGEATRQLVEFPSWFEVRATCNEPNEDGSLCGKIHIFTLSHLSRWNEIPKPFARCDLGIVVKGK